jgi:hypothetical protein
MNRISRTVVFGLAVMCGARPAVAANSEGNPEKSAEYSTITPTEAPNETAAHRSSQHKKLQRLLEAFLGIQTQLSSRVKELLDTYGQADVDKIYQGIDLSTPAGIEVARQRVTAFNALTDGFAAALEKSWAAFEGIVKTNDLDDPLASEFAASWSADSAGMIPNHRAWTLAMRNDGAAVTKLLEVAERHVGQLQYADGHLFTSDKSASIDLLAAQQAVTLAERRCTETGTPSLVRPKYQTVRFVLSALKELEKHMPRTDGT